MGLVGLNIGACPPSAAEQSTRGYLAQVKGGSHFQWLHLKSAPDLLRELCIAALVFHLKWTVL